MKVGLRISFVIAIIVLLAIHWLIFREKEGFYDDSSDYTALSAKVKTKLSNYCKLADLIHEQLVTGYAGTNPDSASSATEQVNNGYKEMYLCTDDKASSRPSCSKPNATDMTYTSSDTYMKMPAWTDDISAVTALVKIKDDLPERVTREADYFEQIIKELQSFLDTGANPPTVPPTAEQLKEPFTGTCCPPKLELLKLLSVGSKSCALPALKPEIKRVKKLLDNRALLAALARCDSLLTRMSLIQTQIDKLKKGELYEWQKNGPPRSYEKFGGGDNTQALLFSLRQNQ